MKKVIRIGLKRKSKVTVQEMALTSNLKSKVELIQALIPIGLEAVAEELKHEVEELAGIKHSRQGGLPGHHRWGSQEGSIYLSDQKLRVRVSRVRDLTRNKEVALESYRLLQEPRAADEGVMRRILSGLSCRNYEGCAEAVPEAFGMSSSTISRRFIKASANKLRELMERDLSGYDFVALFIDGKSFVQDEMIIALGVTMSGEKVVLGFIQAATEKEGVVKDFLQGYIDRGFPIDQGLLCIIDGAKGIRAAIQKGVWGKSAGVTVSMAGDAAKAEV